MDFEEVLMKAGGFGLFNKTVLVLALILSGIHTGLYSFGHFLILVAPSSEWCFLNDTSPSREDITKLPRGKCQGAVGLIGEIYNHNHTIFLEGLKTCPTGWQYDYDEYFPTITAENHWVCGDSWKLYTVHSAFWLGSMAGYLVCGLLADRIGRKKTAMILTGIGTSANVAGTYCTGLVGFSLLRFFAGMGAQTVNSLILVLVLECTVSGKRTLMVFLWGSMWCLMGSSLPWYCYLAQSWRSVLYAAIAADLGMLLCLMSQTLLECTVSGKRTLMVFLWGSMWCLMGSSLPWYCYLAQSWRSVLYAAIAADLGMLLCLVKIMEGSFWKDLVIFSPSCGSWQTHGGLRFLVPPIKKKTNGDRNNKKPVYRSVFVFFRLAGTHRYPVKDACTGVPPLVFFKTGKGYFYALRFLAPSSPRCTGPAREIPRIDLVAIGDS
ncbi:hypothetical protein HPB48_014725 [Haemaphysalis longicornis]|uniref:Uncharacterized protein n=1 Tax=Haemaphysalis longicornis TaxID=44386 RepID=A0A9J6G6L6_HAELO|nr:hypothetical protein HPB48_014725 [Haemaphysalis longicornis]